jgi:hypothetical protein
MNTGAKQMHSCSTQSNADSSKQAAYMRMAARRFCKLRRCDVAAATRSIAEMLGPEFAIQACGLAEIERGRGIPTVYQLSSLCAVYGLEMRQMVVWYSSKPRVEMARAAAA